MSNYLPAETARETILGIAQNVKARIKIRAKLYGLPIQENDLSMMIVAAFFEGVDAGRKEARETQAEQEKRAAVEAPAQPAAPVAPPVKPAAPAVKPAVKRPRR